VAALTLHLWGVVGQGVAPSVSAEQAANSSSRGAARHSRLEECQETGPAASTAVPHWARHAPTCVTTAVPFGMLTCPSAEAMPPLVFWSSPANSCTRCSACGAQEVREQQQQQQQQQQHVTYDPRCAASRSNLCQAEAHGGVGRTSNLHMLLRLSSLPSREWKDARLSVRA
jgi:hypothetical protein